MSFFTFGMGEDKRRWYPFVGAVVGAACAISMIWSVFYPLLMTKFGMSTVTPFAIGASCVGGFNMIVGPLIGGPLLDKKGPKMTFGLAVIAFVVAIFCMYQLDGAPIWDTGRMWWIAGSCCVGFGIGLYSSTMSATTSKWNPDNVGWAVGIDNIGPAIAPFWAAPLANMIVPQLGIGNGFAVMLGLGACGLFFFGFLPFRAPDPGWQPKDPVKKKDTKKEAVKQKSLAEEANEKALPLKEIFKSPKLWIMAVIFICNCVGFMMFTMNLSTIYLEGQSSYMERAAVTALAATMISIGSIANACGRPVMGLVLDKLRSPWKTLAIVYGCFIVMLIFMAIVYKQPGYLICVATVCIYFFGGGVAPIQMSTAPMLFGTKNSGTLIMVTLVATGVAWVIAPVIGSTIYDVTGTYFYALIVMICSVSISCILSIIMRQFEKKEAAKKAEVLASVAAEEAAENAEVAEANAEVAEANAGA